MKQKTLFCLLCVILLLLCGCAKAAVNREKLSEEGKLLYDRFYADGDAIVHDAFTDFDVKVDGVLAVHNEQKDEVGVFISVEFYPKWEKDITHMSIFVLPTSAMRDKVETIGGGEPWHDDNFSVWGSSSQSLFPEPIAIGTSETYFSKPLSEIGMTPDEFVNAMRDVTVEVYLSGNVKERAVLRYDGEITIETVDYEKRELGIFNFEHMMDQ